MSLLRLKLLAITAPAVVMLALELARRQLWPRLGFTEGRFWLDCLVVASAMLFYGILCSSADHILTRLRRQNEELEGLHQASLAIVSELSLESVLQRIADQAKQLIGARYCAVAIYRKDHSIEAFITSGISQETRARIGTLPVGQGLLGVPLREAELLRLKDLHSDPRSVGFPEGHPDMHSLLAVPIAASDPFRGNLYLTEKLGGSDFDEEDEIAVSRFATQAAVAVNNAQLHQQAANLATTEERLRIARELHDDQAQVLAYVNTEAEVAKEHLHSLRFDRAQEHLDKLAGAARQVYTDVREDIMCLRSGTDQDCDLIAAIRSFASRWQRQSGIPVHLSLETDGSRLAADAELQLLRVIQESLTNVRKHARASEAQLSVEIRGESLQASLIDDGIGFDTAAMDYGRHYSFGLTTMKERCQSVGAELTIESPPDGGTRVRVDYPAAPATASTATA